MCTIRVSFSKISLQYGNEYELLQSLGKHFLT